MRSNTSNFSFSLEVKVTRAFFFLALRLLDFSLCSSGFRSAQALIIAAMESDVCQGKRERVGGQCRQVIDKFLQG